MTPDEQPGGGTGGPSDLAAGIADALSALEGLDARPTATHVDAFEHMHTALTDALSAIDGV